MALVYLLHFDRPSPYGRHYLGLAPSEAAIDPTIVPHGRGVRLAPAGRRAAPVAILADTWECRNAAEAWALRERLKKQGGHARKCSICNPNNRRGLWRWPRERQPESGG